MLTYCDERCRGLVRACVDRPALAGGRLRASGRRRAGLRRSRTGLAGSEVAVLLPERAEAPRRSEQGWTVLLHE